MPNIIIMNQGTEHTRGYDPTRLEPLRKSVARCAWLASAHDIILSPVAMEADFVRSIGDALGFDGDSIRVLVHDHLWAEGVMLSEAERQELQNAMSSHEAWTLMPCFWTPDVAQLSREFGLGDPAALAFAAQRGTELFNRKRHFRQLASGAGLPLPEGSVVSSPGELAHAIAQHLPKTGTVIVKKDNSAGGIGNITITEGRIEALPGSKDTRKVGADDARAEVLWEELTDGLGQVLVVEAYHAITHSFYFEYFIDAQGRAELLHSGDVRFRKPDQGDATELVWVGLDTPTSLPHFSLANAVTHAGRFAALAAQVGCRGHINIDAIVTDEGELLFNESNVRWGGGTSLYTIGVNLLGRRFADQHCLSFVRDIQAPPRSETLVELARAELRYSNERREGILVLACEEDRAGSMECLIIADTRERVREIEALARRRLHWPRQRRSSVL